MDVKRFTGVQAGSQKYDLLTAMAVAGLNGSTGFQNSMMRLIAVVTARYNWRNDELTVGQRDMARMWSVNERTVKREIKRLCDAKIVLQLRPGVRGRVAAYRLNYAEIYRLSEPVWANVGPDFEARMEAQSPKPESAEKIVKVDFGQRRDTPQQNRNDAWSKVLARLEESNAGLFHSWYASLQFEKFESGILTIRASSDFTAQYIQTHHLAPLLGAAQLELGAVRRIEFR
jgi:DNA-binding Lrp family transcriptional regulator